MIRPGVARLTWEAFLSDKRMSGPEPEGKGSPDASFAVSPPQVSLPKGGGAIRGLGEKFGTNPVSGTGTLSIPVLASPGRAGFGPQLSVDYGSGTGNGLFGLGWHHSLASVSRKTDKGLPLYHNDHRERAPPDVFTLTGVEDLAPMLVQGAGGDWTHDVAPRVVGGVAYRVERFRPRVEGRFSRIERWTAEAAPGNVFWRSISGDNVTSWFGRTSNSRIADPDDPARIFIWLVCESHDDKGNAIAYDYKPEDSDGVDVDQVHERNRSGSTRGVNRYIKRIRYGNRTAWLPELKPTSPWPTLPAADQWHFELVFDYGEHDTSTSTPDIESRTWPARADPYSSRRSGFEMRTYRLCRRVLMFNRFPELGSGPGTAPCLVGSTNFMHDETPLASYLVAASRSGHARRADGSYFAKSLPASRFTYSEAKVDAATPVRSLDRDSGLQLPEGVDGGRYAFVDLDGEGLPGILSRQGGGWSYKRNLSPAPEPSSDEPGVTHARFGPARDVATFPAMALAPASKPLFLDLAGDGVLAAVQFDGPDPGFHERTQDRSWDGFVPFRAWPNVDWKDPNLRFIDLTGDGLADIAITEDDALLWHSSLAGEGFGAASIVRQALDEETGPRCVFGEAEQSIFLADMSGDGLTDIVRIRHADVCYWPNLGYGRFGAKITMGGLSRFDLPERFDAARIRLADIDGSGVADIIYLSTDGPRLYFNQAGNSWSAPTTLSQCPVFDSASTVTTADLLGNGTACLVWSSPLAPHALRPLKYIELMREKPHLLTGVVNNLGAETRVHYAPSTRFYLADEEAGRPWITRLPFPVHVVERVEVYDWISRSRFTTRHAYHHGYFDASEREFRGFGMVEQFDTEEYASLVQSGELPTGVNVAQASHMPPVCTRTWFHTGAWFTGETIGRRYAQEYFGAPYPADANYATEFDRFIATLLPDTVVAAGLTPAEEREACRALKGAMLRQEVFALDGSARQGVPFSVSEHTHAVERVQPLAPNRHGVFFTHARESITWQHERDPTDPRIQHEMVLSVDAFGHATRTMSIAYPRRVPMPGAPEQAATHVTLQADRVVHRAGDADGHRLGIPIETRRFEVTKPPAIAPSGPPRLDVQAMMALVESLFPSTSTEPPGGQTTPSEDWNWRASWNPVVDPGGPGVSKLRLLAHARTLYRKDDLSSALPLGSVESLAIPDQSYQLAMTPALVSQVYGPRVSGAMLAGEGRHVHSVGDANWWRPSGRVFLSPGSADTAAQELAHARQHFFLPCRFRDPFHTAAVPCETVATYDPHDLFVVQTVDPAGNDVRARIDYRVLQPSLLTDANGNRSEVVFDMLGLVAGSAVMGKTTESLGDSLVGFDADPGDAQVQAFFDAPDPRSSAAALLKDASTRFLHDLGRFERTRTLHPADPSKWEPGVSATLSRETHASDPVPPSGLAVRTVVSHSDGFGHEIQTKLPAEAGPVVDGGPAVDPRWVSNGWTIYNNKGKPVRQYEPFFSATHRFEFAHLVGVGPLLLYDPMGRVVATLHPDNTVEKIVIDPWRQTTWDANDTLLLDPKTDPDLRGLFTRLPDDDYLPTWFQRASASPDADERNAAQRALPHAATPAVTHFDPLGRAFLNIADNGMFGQYTSRIEQDVEGRRRSVVDALGRIVTRDDYDLLGNRIHEASMEAGERWTLTDVAGKPLYRWDSRGHRFRQVHDRLQRPIESHVVDGAGPETMVGRIVYGESRVNAEADNLRGKVLQTFDQAGVVTTDAYDFKGNLLHGQRRLAQAYSSTLAWSGPVALDAVAYSNRTRYDALNRPIQAIAPHGDQPGFTVNVVQPSYNAANLLVGVDVWLDLASEPTGLLAPATADLQAVANIDYDAKGRRTAIDLGNGARTTYVHDPLTQRLMAIATRRGADALQDLHYTFDPVGNITHVRDDAQQTIYFDNRRVEPSADYTYDAIYRLVEARGREHLGQAGGSPIPHTYRDASRIRLLHPGDGNAMGRYVERYAYDEAGNFETMKHVGTDPANSGWERVYGYAEPSQIEPGKPSNRLTSASTDASAPEVFSTAGDGYDEHGNMLRMPQLQEMRWDFNDQLRMTRRQKVNAVDADGNARQGERTWYVYDAYGERVRKVTELASGAVKDERIYLGGFEIHRDTASAIVRETLHVADDRQRVALIETRTQGIEPGVPRRLVRYQFSNHLGSASLELDDRARIISYEEYTPYGSTSYQAVRNRTETPKRYRFTGKERDEESGLGYHGARYYAAWLGRWTACDPVGMDAGCNLFVYVRGNPILYHDPTGTQEALSPEQQGWLDAHPQVAKDTSMFSDTARRSTIEAGMADDKRKQASASVAPKQAPRSQMEVRAAIHETEADRDLRRSIDAAESRAHRQKENPNSYDILIGSTAIVAKAADPSGMGLIKAPVAAIYMAAGQDVHDAQKHAGNVDAIAGIYAMLVLPGRVETMPSTVVDDPGVVIETDGVSKQVDYFTENIPGITPAQAAMLLNKAFSRGSNVVLGGSRVRGNHKAGSDLDVGFDSLNANHSGKVKGPVNKLGPLRLDPTQIVPGNETPTLEIHNPGEFFQRSGIRAAPDPRAGEPYQPSGSITFEPDGTIHLLGPTPYRL